MDSIAYPIAMSAVASFAAALALVLTTSQHGRFTMDAPGAIQKFHLHPTPRIGGIGIYLALVAASQLMSSLEAKRILDTILVAGIPALVAGLLEDLTKRISVRTRLLATMGSGLVACWMSGVMLTHLQVPFVDQLLGWTPIAVLFTIFAIGGIANAINIIDGFHGLASGTATIALLALAGIAALVGDTPLVVTAVILAAAVTGFWLVNFPWGKLFLGDGGAYFAGFALAWLAVLLPMRNAQVSPWASFLVCAYPVIEVLYSIVRRGLRRESPGNPDRHHLHSLVATKLVQPKLRNLHPTLQNSAVSVLMWVCAAAPAVAAVALYQRPIALWFCAGACVLLYHMLYRYLVRL